MSAKPHKPLSAELLALVSSVVKYIDETDQQAGQPKKENFQKKEVPK